MGPVRSGGALAAANSATFSPAKRPKCNHTKPADGPGSCTPSLFSGPITRAREFQRLLYHTYHTYHAVRGCIRLVPSGHASSKKNPHATCTARSAKASYPAREGGRPDVAHDNGGSSWPAGNVVHIRDGPADDSEHARRVEGPHDKSAGSLSRPADGKKERKDGR